MKKIILILMLAVVMLLTAITASADEMPKMIRVGLYFGSSSLSEATVSADGGVYVHASDFDFGWHEKAVVTINQNEWQISGGENTVSSSSDKITISSAGGFLTINGKQYRGQIELVPNNEKINVVNYLDIEEYLYGVVPLEMATGWHPEALKTQAVCARTYAIKSMGKYMSQGFDVYNTTMSQVYGGVSVEKDDCTAAVEDTRGMVITYDGKLIDAVYSSASSNFHTFSNKDVWGSNTPYLVGVEDTYQHLVKPDSSAWEKTFTLSELESILEQKQINIGGLKDLVIDSVSPEGAVTELRFVGTNGSHTVKKDAARTFLNLRSQGYTILKEGGETPVSVLSSKGVVTANDVVAVGKDGKLGALNYILNNSGKNFRLEQSGFKSVTLKGSGYGHGLGMSQWGAYGMAKAGFNYEDIIKHYYQGVELTIAE